MNCFFDILIVDDKKLDRDGICFLIKQNNLPLNTFTAANGEEALNLLDRQHFDILLTDIRMPSMTGLELIKESKKRYDDLKFIIFSSYGDFEYAKTAINIGIEDYLLKPVKINEFTDCLRKILAELFEKRNEEASHNIFEMIFDSEKPAKTFSPVSGYLFLIDFVYPYYNHKNPQHELPKDFINVPLNEYQCLIITPDCQSAQNFISDLCEEFSKVDNRYLITCGGAFENVAELREIFHAVERYSDSKFYLTKSEIAYLDNQTVQSEKTAVRQIFTSCSEIAKQVKRHQFESADKLLHELFARLQANRNIPIVVIKSASTELAYECLMLDNDISDDFAAVLTQINESNSIEELNNIVSEIIHRNEGDNSNVLTIQMAIEIIHQNYMKDLRLESVARQVFLSPCYFSALFKRTTGISFLKYLTTYRVEKAMDLLRSTQMRVGEICENVGYSNRSYFCNIFRNYCGMTPNQYREQKDV